MQNKGCALVTGSTDGIGFEAAKLLYEKGLCVIIHGRNEKRAEGAKNQINSREDDMLKTVYGDFTRLEDVRKITDEIKERFSHLNVLVNNAGVFESKRVLTPDGLEATFQVNYLSHFLLTLSLLDILTNNSPSYIINVSSMVHASSYDRHNIQGEKSYDGYEAYSVSKLFNVLFTYRLSRMLKEREIYVYAVHPGVINTKLLKKGWGPVGSDPKMGASNILSPLFVDELREKTGIYVENGRSVPSRPITYKEDERDFLWEYSIKLLKERGINTQTGG